MSRRFFVVLACSITALLCSPVWACPNCKGTIAEDAAAGAADLAGGFNYSILLMLAMPYLLAAAFGGAFYYQTRKASANLPGAGGSSDQPG